MLLPRAVKRFHICACGQHSCRVQLRLLNCRSTQLLHMTGQSIELFSRIYFKLIPSGKEEGKNLQ